MAGLAGAACVMFFKSSIDEFVHRLWVHVWPEDGQPGPLPMTPDVSVLLGVAFGLAALIAWFWPSIMKFLGRDRVETNLHLQIGAFPTLPLEVGNKNLWRWRLDGLLAQSPTGLVPACYVLLWVFDKPTNFRQIKVTGHNMSLPMYEIRDTSARHAFIIFSGPLPPGRLELRLEN